MPSDRSQPEEFRANESDAVLKTGPSLASEEILSLYVTKFPTDFPQNYMIAICGILILFARSGFVSKVRDNLGIWIAELSNIFNISPQAQSKAEIAA